VINSELYNLTAALLILVQTAIKRLSVQTFFILIITIIFNFYLQCFDADDWVAGRASGPYKTERWDAGMVVCLERGAYLHMA